MRKAFIICLVTLVAISSGCTSSKKEIFEVWKPWVAMHTTYGIYDYFNENYGMEGDICDMFYDEEANEEREVRKGHLDGELVSLSDWSNVADEIYRILSNETESKYQSLLLGTPQWKYPTDKEIIMEVIDDFTKDGYWRIETRESDQAMFYYEYPYYYNVDWVFKSDRYKGALAGDIMLKCNRFSKYLEFVNNAVSIYSFEENRAARSPMDKHKVYEVIYKISYGTDTRYALCNVLIKKDGSSEIELVRHKNNLLDLL